MDALAARHDAAVQMIDSFIVRVHQHGACIADNQEDMGRSRGGPTSKIHAVVDSNGLPAPVRRMTTGCIQFCSAHCFPRRCCSRIAATTLRELARQQGAWAYISPKGYRKDPICFSLSVSRTQLIDGCSTRSSNVAMSACRDPIRQTCSQLSYVRQTRINPNLAAC
jgi:hypothetical protein